MFVRTLPVLIVTGLILLNLSHNYAAPNLARRPRQFGSIFSGMLRQDLLIIVTFQKALPRVFKMFVLAITKITSNTVLKQWFGIFRVVIETVARKIFEKITRKHNCYYCGDGRTLFCKISAAEVHPSNGASSSSWSVDRASCRQHH